MARRWAPPWAGTFAVWVFALSPFQVWHGQEVRSYGFLVAAVVLVVFDRYAMLGFAADNGHVYVQLIDGATGDLLYQQTTEETGTWTIDGNDTISTGVF